MLTNSPIVTGIVDNPYRDVSLQSLVWFHTSRTYCAVQYSLCPACFFTFFPGGVLHTSPRYLPGVLPVRSKALASVAPTNPVAYLVNMARTTTITAYIFTPFIPVSVILHPPPTRFPFQHPVNGLVASVTPADTIAEFIDMTRTSTDTAGTITVCSYW